MNMRRRILSGWLLVAGAVLFFSLNAFAIDPVFDTLQWKNRVLVITGPDITEQYVEQVDLLANVRDGLDERAVIVLRYEDRALDKIEGLSSFPFDNRVIEGHDRQKYLQSRLRTDDDVFSVVLVGLDGETKQVWNTVVDPQEIFDVIDAMPMRERVMNAQD